jgi:endonuclease-3
MNKTARSLKDDGALRPGAGREDASRARAILRKLSKCYPAARCELDHNGPFQLLAATLLSAQCTDRNVNRATPELFRRWPTAETLAVAPVDQVEACIRSLGLFRSKAKHLVGMAQGLVRDHRGSVPNDLESLTALPGVGRKTALVVLANAFGVPALAVDTHVLRLGRRMGFFSTEDPLKAERALCALLPSKDWCQSSHLLIWHGRRVCAARTPQCGLCAVRALCPSAAKR